MLNANLVLGRFMVTMETICVYVELDTKKSMKRKAAIAEIDSLPIPKITPCNLHLRQYAAMEGMFSRIYMIKAYKYAVM